VTRKVVLILGRFTPERKVILDEIRERLRVRNLVPVLFDFDAPAERDVSETVMILAQMSRFVVADLTSPRSIPQELALVVPHIRVPVVPILQLGEEPWAMFEDLRKYPWVGMTVHYGPESSSLDDDVIAVAEQLRRQLGRP
jgi:hypothetical protein